jgi:hypothetical protein
MCFLGRTQAALPALRFRADPFNRDWVFSGRNMLLVPARGERGGPVVRGRKEPRWRAMLEGGSRYGKGRY